MKLDERVIEATQRAYEQALITKGREPTLAETTLVLLQAQLAVLASSMFDDEEIIEFWDNVISVIRGNTDPGEAS